MRISYSMIYDQSEININKQYESYFKLNEKISSGKEVNRPSDDPTAMGQILGYRSRISSLEQYKKNIDRGNAWLDATYAALKQADILLIEAIPLAVQMSHEPNEAQLDIIAPQIRQIAEQLLQIANSSVTGKYIFSGHKTETLPFTMDEDLNVTYHGDNNKIKYSIDDTTDVAVNFNGHETFIDGTNVFDVLKDLHDAMESGDALEVGPSLNKWEDSLKTAQKQIVEKMSTLGSFMNRFDSAAEQAEDFKFIAEDLMVETENTDMVKRLTELQARETAFNAALKSSSVITKLSLLNFI